MSPIDSLLVFMIALVGGGVGSLAGFGGGVFLVPILSLVLGIPLRAAIAASAISVVVTSLTATRVYLRQGKVNIRLAIVLQLTAALGAAFGGFLVVYAPVALLQIVFGLTLYGVVVALLRRPTSSDYSAENADPFGLETSYNEPATEEEVTYVPRRVGLGMTFSTGIGLLAGMLGMGGGPLNVPVMSMVMGVPLKAAAATSTFMVGMTASIGALVYFAGGLVEAAVTLPAIFGILVGATLGARFSSRAPAKLIRYVLIVVLTILATMMLFEAVG